MLTLQLYFYAAVWLDVDVGDALEEQVHPLLAFFLHCEVLLELVHTELGLRQPHSPRRLYQSESEADGVGGSDGGDGCWLSVEEIVLEEVLFGTEEDVTNAGHSVMI